MNETHGGFRGKIFFLRRERRVIGCIWTLLSQGPGLNPSSIS